MSSTRAIRASAVNFVRFGRIAPTPTATQRPGATYLHPPGLPHSHRVVSSICGSTRWHVTCTSRARVDSGSLKLEEVMFTRTDSDQWVMHPVIHGAVIDAMASAR